MTFLNDPDAKIAYNLVMFKDGIIVIQREQECFNENISINGFVVVGSLGSTNEERY